MQLDLIRWEPTGKKWLKMQDEECRLQGEMNADSRISNSRALS